MTGSLGEVRGAGKAAPAVRATAAHGTLRPERPTFTLEEFFILGLLKDREMYGLEVVRSLAAHSDVGLVSGTGVVYPILKMLVKEGALSTRRAAGAPRTYYRATSQGLERFIAIAKRLEGLNHTVQLLIAGL